VELVNLSAEPLGRLHSWIPHDLMAEKVVFLPDACPGKSPLPTGTAVLPGVEIFSPLTRRRCLLLQDRARRITKVMPGKMVREINKFMMVGARFNQNDVPRQSFLDVRFSAGGHSSNPALRLFC
jgi:hypothetical protein